MEYKHRFSTMVVELLPMIEMQIKRVESFSFSVKGQKNKLYAGVWMPDALERKYQHANKSLAW